MNPGPARPGPGRAGSGPENPHPRRRLSRIAGRAGTAIKDAAMAASGVKEDLDKYNRTEQHVLRRHHSLDSLMRRRLPINEGMSVELQEDIARLRQEFEDIAQEVTGMIHDPEPSRISRLLSPNISRLEDLDGRLKALAPRLTMLAGHRRTEEWQATAAQQLSEILEQLHNLSDSLTSVVQDQVNVPYALFHHALAPDQGRVFDPGIATKLDAIQKQLKDTQSRQFFYMALSVKRLT